LKAKTCSDTAKERIASEVRIGRAIQLGILPSDISLCKQGTGLDIHAFLEPAKDAGGVPHHAGGHLQSDDITIVAVRTIYSPREYYERVLTTLERIEDGGVKEQIGGGGSRAWPAWGEPWSR
jgi:hypothetical protein